MAGILGCLGVILGATGKHALEGKVDEELSRDLKPVSVIIKHTELHYLPLLYLACVSLVLAPEISHYFGMAYLPWHGLLRQFVSYGIHGYLDFGKLLL